MIGEAHQLTVHVERPHPGFTKWHLNQGGEQPWPFRPVLHHFTAADVGEDFHDHPWAFRSIVLRGSYVEEYQSPLDGSFRKRTRYAGDAFDVEAEHIHRIIELPSRECWTWVEYGPTVRTSMFYRFEAGRVLSRPWHQPEFST